VREGLLHWSTRYEKITRLNILRYPGGKYWFIPRAVRFIKSLPERPKILIEPFGGGACIGLTLLASDLIDKLVLVELDSDIAAFWRAALDGSLIPKVRDFKCNRKNVINVIKNKLNDPAFYVLVKNRCSMGGLIHNGGLVRNEKNGLGIAYRWNKTSLITKLELIHSLASKIEFIEGDGIQVLKERNKKGYTAFIDPPYVVAGKQLYQCWYLDHESLIKVLSKWEGDWVATYDDNPTIITLAKEYQLPHKRIAMTTNLKKEKKELVLAKDLSWL